MILTAGQVASYGLSFLRNMILARMLTKADFGLAAVFGMTISMLELAGRMSFGQQIIQAKDGDSEAFVASSHSFQFSLALFGAVLLAAFSYPLACAFKVPHLTWAFALLALVPLARSIENLDYYRRQREMQFLPAVLVEFVPQAVVTLAAWPLAIWLGDFRVIVVLMLAKAVLGIVMTHAIAARPYRWNWHADYFSRMWRFGWPLLINGALMFAAQQADQMVVGAFLTLDDLANYALVVSVVSVPFFIFSQVLNSLMLPMLSRVQGDPVQFRQQYRMCMTVVGLGAVWLIAPLIVTGEQLVSLLFGSKYVGAGPLMAVLGTVCAVRLFRLVPTIAAMARADTHNHLQSNIWRSMGLPLAVLVALVGGGAIGVAGAALLAEVAATFISLLRLRRKQGIALRDTVVAAAYVLGILGLALILVCWNVPQRSYGMAVACLFGILLGATAVAWKAFPQTLDVIMRYARSGGRVAGAGSPRIGA